MNKSVKRIVRLMGRELAHPFGKATIDRFNMWGNIIYFVSLSVSILWAFHDLSTFPLAFAVPCCWIAYWLKSKASIMKSKSYNVNKYVKHMESLI